MGILGKVWPDRYSQLLAVQGIDLSLIFELRFRHSYVRFFDQNVCHL